MSQKPSISLNLFVSHQTVFPPVYITPEISRAWSDWHLMQVRWSKHEKKKDCCPHCCRSELYRCHGTCLRMQNCHLVASEMCCSCHYSEAYVKTPTEAPADSLGSGPWSCPQTRSFGHKKHQTQTRCSPNVMKTIKTTEQELTRTAHSQTDTEQWSHQDSVRERGV